MYTVAGTLSSAAKLWVGSFPLAIISAASDEVAGQLLSQSTEQHVYGSPPILDQSGERQAEELREGCSLRIGRGIFIPSPNKEWLPRRSSQDKGSACGGRPWFNATKSFFSAGKELIWTYYRVVEDRAGRPREPDLCHCRTRGEFRRT